MLTEHAHESCYRSTHVLHKQVMLLLGLYSYNLAIIADPWEAP